METIKLDLVPGKKMPSLHASQYDDGREHGIDLFENGVVYKLDGTETLTINERKGDDCICSLDIENTFTGSNHIVFASTEQMCAVWGNNICELVIKRGSVTLGTLNFILEIEPCPTEGGIESESEIKNLERQIEEITEEVIGDNYYTKTQTDNAIETAIEGKADKTYVDTELAKKADKNNTYTKSEVDTLIDNLPEPMIFKGTLGVGGTIQTLPTASASNEGFTYKVITDGTYAGQTAKVGDVFTSNGSAWVYIPSGDEDNDTWRNIKVNGVEKLGNGISSGAVDFVGSENIDVEFDANGNKIGIKTKNIYTKEEVDDIVYNILPDDTASGSVANFETDLALPLKSLEIDVNAKQDLHGQENPYPAGSGKNKLNVTAQSSTVNGVTFTVNADGTVVANGTANANAILILGTASLKAGNYIANGIQGGASGQTLIRIYSESTTIKYVYDGDTPFSLETDTDVIVAIYVYNGFSVSNKTYSPMIRLATETDPTFAPYENICPIEGWSAISPVNCGKNLFNMDYLTASGITIVSGEASGTATAFNSAFGVIGLGLKNKFRFKSNTQYSISFKAYTDGNASTSGQGFRFAFWYTDGTSSFVQCPNNTASYTEFSTVSTSGKTIDHVTILYSGGGANVWHVKDMQLEENSSATSFEPFNGNTEVINLGGTYYGGHFTQDKAGHRRFEVTHNYIASYNGETINEPWISSMDAYSQGATPTTGAQVVYPLATPIIIDLPDGEPIITLNGTNNIYADTGDTEVVFKCSVNDYVSAHSGGNLLGMGGVYLGGAKSGGGEEETDEGEETEKTKLDEPKEEVKEIGDMKKLGGE